MIQQKLSGAPVKNMFDAVLLTAGMILGALLGATILWTWLDYQRNPSGSWLAASSIQLAQLFPFGVRTYLERQSNLMGLPLSSETSAYWYMARAGGVIAYLLMWASVVWGLLLSTKILGKQLVASVAYGAHEFLSILSIIFAALHALVLLGDSYIEFKIWHLIIPFSAPYKSFATGLGTISLILSAALLLSFYVRKRIGQKLWRKLHYFTFLGFVLAVVHGIMAGTDSASWGMISVYWFSGLSVLFLVYYRLFTLQLRPKRASRLPSVTQK